MTAKIFMNKIIYIERPDIGYGLTMSKMLFFPLSRGKLHKKLTEAKLTYIEQFFFSILDEWLKNILHGFLVFIRQIDNLLNDVWVHSNEISSTISTPTIEIIILNTFN